MSFHTYFYCPRYSAKKHGTFEECAMKYALGILADDAPCKYEDYPCSSEKNHTYEVAVQPGHTSLPVEVCRYLCKSSFQTYRPYIKIGQ
jgi:hypothetical protein